MFELCCLGETTLRDPTGVLVRFRSRKHLALLIYLALNHGRMQRRERLAGLLWSETEDSRARHSLSQALYSIRRVLPDNVRVTGEEISLNTASLWIDIAEFEERLAKGDPESAASLYRGDFLEGFWIRGASSFEEWVGHERARLGSLARDALRQAIKSAQNKCAWPVVVAQAQRLVRLDPYDEVAYSEWMRALWMIGDRVGALQRYDDLRRVLASDLDAVPSVETEDLVERIRCRPVRGVRISPPAIGESRENFEEPALFGRQSELGVLGDMRDSVAHGRTRVVLVQGSAGMGKTRLVNEFLRSLDLDNVLTLRGRCYEAERSIPYGPVAEALKQSIEALSLSKSSRKWLSEIARLIPELHDRIDNLAQAASLDAAGSRRRLYEAVAQGVKSICQMQPVVLFVDDLQWCDDSSVSLLHYILRRVSSRLLFIGTYRPEDASNQNNPGIITAGLEEQGCTIQLKPLSTIESLNLVKSLIKAGTYNVEPNLLATKSGGNPLFAIELCRSVSERSRPFDTTREALPPNLSNIFERQLHALTPPVVAFLEQAACLGSNVPSETLQSASGLCVLDYRTRLHQLVRAGLLVEEDGQVSFRHQLIQEFVRQRLPAQSWRQLHWRAARALMRGSGSIGEIALHLAAAGARQRAYHYAVRAANAAEAISASKEAADFLELALNQATTDRSRIGLIGRLGRLYWQLREYDKARPLFEAHLRQLSRGAGPVKASIRARVGLLLLNVESGAMTARESVVALERIHSDYSRARVNEPKLEVEILQKLFWAAARCGAGAKAERAIEQIHIAYSMYPDPGTRWRTARILGIHECYRGDLRRAEAYLRMSLKAAQQCDDRSAVLDCYIGLSVLVVRTMSKMLAEELLGKALRVAEQLGDPARNYQLLANCALCYQHRHEVERAESLFNAAHELLVNGGSLVGDIPSINYDLGHIAYLRGDLQNAESYWITALKASEDQGVLAHRIECIAALGRLALERSDIPEARALAAKALWQRRRLRFYDDDRRVLEDLLARLSFMAGRKQKAINRLRKVASVARERDIPLYLAVQLTRLELLGMTGSQIEAIHVREEIRAVGESIGADWFLQQAERVMGGSVRSTGKT